MVEELYICQPEGLCAMSCASVFTWLEEEIEGNGDHVSSGSVDGISTCMGNIGNVDEDLDGDGFDMVWGQVNFAIAGQLVLEAEVNVAMGVKVGGVWGPQTKERLCNAL